MNAGQLLAHFHRISDAPDAIPRLRRFILDLAVRGKLVEQDSDDEPASILLQRLTLSLAKNRDNERIRNRRDVLPTAVQFFGNATFPPSWVLTNFDSVNSIVSGVTKGKNLQGLKTATYPYLRVANVQRGYLDLQVVKQLEIRADDFERYRLRKGDVLMTEGGDWDKLGRAAIWNEQVPNCIHQNHIYRIRSAKRADLLPDWIAMFANSPLGRSYFEGASKQTTNLASINMTQLRRCPLPLPPLAEQQRIVAKVDELMALCNRLETAQTDRESRRNRLLVASLHLLNNGVDADAFRDHARFHLRHLPRLTTRPEQIQQLRETILNLAVRGRLVPQDTNDEPASELLKCLQSEKAHLAKNGGLKKDKVAWEGLPKEPPHKLPLNWTWACLQDVFEISRGGSPRPAGDPRYFGGPIPWITVREITKDGGKYLTSTEGGLTEEGANRSRFINPGDLLLTNSSETLGVPKISRIRACMNDGVAVLRLFHPVQLNDFAYLYLHSQTDAFRRVNQGMGQPNLNTPIIAGWFFPLPPLTEQHRIVAKVEELMALCDRLEVQLTTAQNESRHLLEAVLHEALAPAS